VLVLHSSASQTLSALWTPFYIDISPGVARRGRHGCPGYRTRQCESTTRDGIYFDASIDIYPQEIFNFLCRSRRNLVLDSVYPHVTPHIVITPADETWNDYFIPLENRVDPQWPCYLMAAQFEASSAYHRLPIPSSDADQTSSNPALMKTDNLSASHRSYEPKSVFSPSRFIQLVCQLYVSQNSPLIVLQIECSSTERLIMYHVITALQRHQCKAAVRPLLD